MGQSGACSITCTYCCCSRLKNAEAALTILPPFEESYAFRAWKEGVAGPEGRFPLAPTEQQNPASSNLAVFVAKPISLQSALLLRECSITTRLVMPAMRCLQVCAAK